jgi:Skp family chaperone for outer membrane proteins
VEEESAEIEESPTPPDDVNSLKRKFYNIIDSTTPEDLNDTGKFAADALMTIQSESIQVMVDDTVKGSLDIIEGKFKEVNNNMKILDKKVSDEMKKISDEMKKNFDEMKKENSDGLKKVSDEVKKVSDEVKKVSDKLEALPGIVKRAVLAPHERAGQLAEESVRASLHNFPEGGNPPHPR